MDNWEVDATRAFLLLDDLTPQVPETKKALQQYAGTASSKDEEKKGNEEVEGGKEDKQREGYEEDEGNEGNKKDEEN